MKVLRRIIIILIAALAVIGAATALVGNNNATFPDSEPEPRPFRQDHLGDFSTGS